MDGLELEQALNQITRTIYWAKESHGVAGEDITQIRIGKALLSAIVEKSLIKPVDEDIFEIDYSIREPDGEVVSQGTFQVKR